MGSVTGGEAHKRRLRRMLAVAKPVGDAIYDEARRLQVDAQLSITKGATSGASHVPSAPGTPPNNDTGVLAGNIEAKRTGALSAETSSNAPYAGAQEFGYEPGNLPARPYMRPAAARSKGRAPKAIAAAVRKGVRRGGQ